MKCILTIFIILTLNKTILCKNSSHFSKEGKLINKLLMEYSPMIRPRNGRLGATEVKVGMTLLQILSVKEKTQEMEISGYVTYTWQDDRLKWIPNKYEGIEVTRIPVDSIWVPRIVLANGNTDNIQEALRVNALVKYNGNIEWLPPIIYKTTCIIDIALFPYDWQNCSVIFEPADYDQSELVFGFAYEDYITIDINAFVPNGEWDLLQRPISIVTWPVDTKRQQIWFHFILGRKPQFYILNMLYPCFMLLVLSCLTFYLPTISGEKISLTISLLLGDTIFAYLFAQRMPTISEVPWIASYLLFSMLLKSICILLCVIVINVHYRSPSSHKLNPRLKNFFINVLGPALSLHQPKHKWISTNSSQNKKNTMYNGSSLEKSDILDNRKALSEKFYDKHASLFGFQARRRNEPNLIELDPILPSSIQSPPRHLKPSIKHANYIAKHNKSARMKEIVSTMWFIFSTAKVIRDDWAYIAMIIDRLFLWIYISVFVFGSIGFFIKVATSDYPKLMTYG